MSAIFDEKLSSETNTNLLKSTSPQAEDKSNVLEEIAAKVEDLKLDVDAVDASTEVDYRARCDEQEETISTLMGQLRIMMNEYQAMSIDRDHHEELSEALLQRLEIEELIKQNVIPANFLEGGEEGEGDAADSDVVNETTADDAVNETTTDATSEATEPPAGEGESPSTVSRKFSNGDLLRLNNVLLREVYSLRHQVDELRESIYEFLHDSDDDDDSEDDRSDDDGVYGTPPVEEPAKLAEATEASTKESTATGADVAME